MYAKIEITGTIEACTGIHIGGSTQFSAIGAVDSPVIRDVLTDKPMIPGSSLKGKMRALLAKQYNKEPLKVRVPDDDDPGIVRLFGSSREHKSSRLIFSDMMLINEEALKKMGIVSTTEVKFENSINRLTAIANPRQIERAIRGTQYSFRLIYNAMEEGEIIPDFEMIVEGLRLLQYDYIGGSGSRGYGKIRFKDLYAALVVGELDENTVATCKNLLKEV